MVHAQRFFNLTAEQVRIDSLLPMFTHKIPLGSGYADSTYTITIEYPEFIAMSEADVERYHRITQAPLPPMPEVSQLLSIDRKRGELTVSFMPLVFRDGQYQKLVSFMLDVRSKKAAVSSKRVEGRGQRAEGSRYAEHSVLASGRWVKISVPSTGVYQLSSELVRQAGFNDINKVKIYGYGGAMQPEQLNADYLVATDDLKEVPTCEVNGKRLFYAVGPVTWNSNNRRVRNPYSTVGCYFLTENDEAPQTIGSEEFLASFYPAADDYNALYEVDDYAWFHGGRNLYDATAITAGNSHTFNVPAKVAADKAVMTINVTSDVAAQVFVSVNDVPVDTISIPSSGSYDHMRQMESVKTITNVQTMNKVTLSTTSTTAVRLDYVAIHTDEAAAAPDLSAGTFPVPEYVYGITNQDHHADGPVDMVIIIPTTQKLLAEAERLKTLHEQQDSMRVRIVPADELFNEFSSGTPDANAYRRYLKMLYDRAATDADLPRYLLLMGDAAWDNRMLSSSWKDCSPDDFLLCYESENSYNATQCFVSDDYFCLLDDGEGNNVLVGKPDVAVGRISARTAEDAEIVVDKITNYTKNSNAGSWQNVLFFMGDDGNQNAHMHDADSVAKQVENLYPNYQVKRVMWDAYTRVSSSTGNSYPDVTRLIKQQMQQGALMMNYSGHGGPTAISHEYVLKLADFENTSPRLPLWMTASCDIMPFDGQEENIGETAMFNKKGGAIAFYGTTRTVYQPQNFLMNIAFTRHLLSKDATGRTMPIGEAVRLTKNELVGTGVFSGYDASGKPVYTTDRSVNRMQYSLLGDPAMRLAAPSLGIEVDSINGVAMKSGVTLTLAAGTTATVSGHVVALNGQRDNGFNGTVTAIVRDAREKIVCKMNNTSETEVPFVYYDRPNVIFNGSDQIKDGRFSFTFAVPKDISYSTETGLINLYAVNDERTEIASGICSQLVMGSGSGGSTSEMGPSIYCYLNSPSFNNGDKVNPTPYFVAELTDEDGINATGSSIGHDLQLIIDGEMAKTYSLNEYFQYDFGSYTKGTVGFSIPTLSYGEHKLLFRAWDVLNNSSTAELTFNVVKGLEPSVFDVNCLKNPATTNTSFIIQHDRVGSQMDVILDIFDISGRHLWSHSDSGVSTDTTYSLTWDLSVDGGRRLQTGVYLYRVRLSCDGSNYVSKAKKLIILTHK
jgi:hypothetical protein